MNGDKKDKKLYDAVTSIMDASMADKAHAGHTTKQALHLFDLLAIMHKLSSRERLLLEVSSLLHDIGWSRTARSGHHKHSRDMIREADLPDLTGKEKNICALIARYHNKAEPDASRHRGFADLKKPGRLTVSWCAAILRVSDGLDCNHNSSVHVAGCNIEKTRLTILLKAQHDCAREIRGAQRKGGLLASMAERDLVFLKC